jgi:hypothetical protein
MFAQTGCADREKVERRGIAVVISLPMFPVSFDRSELRAFDHPARARRFDGTPLLLSWPTMAAAQSTLEHLCRSAARPISKRITC